MEAEGTMEGEHDDPEGGREGWASVGRPGVERRARRKGDVGQAGALSAMGCAGWSHTEAGESVAGGNAATCLAWSHRAAYLGGRGGGVIQDKRHTPRSQGVRRLRETDHCDGDWVISPVSAPLSQT